mgnify:FL=1
MPLHLWSIHVKRCRPLDWMEPNRAAALLIEECVAHIE